MMPRSVIQTLTAEAAKDWLTSGHAGRWSTLPFLQTCEGEKKKQLIQIEMLLLPSKGRGFGRIVSVFSFSGLHLDNVTSLSPWKSIRFIPEPWHSIN